MIIFYTVTGLFSTLFLTFLLQLERNMRQFRISPSPEPSEDLPTVSICIPARNETHAMTQCLERVLASDYRKMEVIVFDDESADDTSILINSFAHAGVRFIPGAELPEGWLGKNHALEVLAREASGKYIYFLDVDTHIQPTTISQLVRYMSAEKLEMASVIPDRNDTWRLNVLFGCLRYYWTILLSRAAAPATASSLWVINRRTLLETIGGFAPFKAEVSPEVRFAAIIGSAAYRCLLSAQQLGVSYEKRWQSQCETSRRLLYPMAGGTWYRGLAALLILLMLNLPFVVVVSSIFVGWTSYHALAVTLVLTFAVLYARYAYVIWRRHWWVAGLVWPVVILQELILFISSLIGYARGTITWKGRPVVSPKRAQIVSAKSN
jgi:chlorobactene glucosyltransferase